MLPQRGRKAAQPPVEHTILKVGEAPAGLYQVISGRSGEKYTVITEDGALRCNCVGFANRRSCSHVAQVSDLQAREAGQK